MVERAATLANAVKDRCSCGRAKESLKSGDLGNSESKDVVAERKDIAHEKQQIVGPVGEKSTSAQASRGDIEANIARLVASITKDMGNFAAHNEEEKDGDSVARSCEATDGDSVARVCEVTDGIC